MEEIYAELRKTTALAEIIRNETEDLDVEPESRAWKAWNRLIELTGLLEDKLHALTDCAGELT